MELMLSNVARTMSEEVTKFLEEDVNIPEDSIVKLPICGDYNEDDMMYACQYKGFVIVACIEEGRVAEVKVVGWHEKASHELKFMRYLFCFSDFIFRTNIFFFHQILKLNFYWLI